MRDEQSRSHKNCVNQKIGKFLIYEIQWNRSFYLFRALLFSGNSVYFYLAGTNFLPIVSPHFFACTLWDVIVERTRFVLLPSVSLLWISRIRYWGLFFFSSFLTSMMPFVFLRLFALISYCVAFKLPSFSFILLRAKYVWKKWPARQVGKEKSKQQKKKTISHKSKFITTVPSLNIISSVFMNHWSTSDHSEIIQSFAYDIESSMTIEEVKCKLLWRMPCNL